MNLCRYCEIMEATPYLCSGCQWGLVENPKHLKEIEKLVKKLRKKELRARELRSGYES